MFTQLLIMTSLLVLGVEASQPKCTPESMMKDACNLFEKHKDNPNIKTSDGRRIRKPDVEQNEKNLNNTTETVYGVTSPSVEQSAAAMDQMIEHQLQFDSILEESDFRNLPRRSQKVIVQSFAIQSLILQDEKSAGGFGMGGYSVPMVPENLETGEGKLRPATPDDLEKIAKIIGPEALAKLTDLQKKAMEQWQRQMATIKTTYTRINKNPNESDDIAERTRRMKNLTQYAKGQMIEMVRAGRKDSQLTQAQKNMIKKIETIEYQDESQLGSQGVSPCQATTENAFYFAESHTFTFCPKYLEFSDAEVIRTIAHEIGHSIDPCRAPNVLLKINKAAVDDWLSKNPKEGNGNQDKAQKRILLEHFQTQKSDYTNNFDDAEKLKEYLGGRLSPYFEVVAIPTPPSQYPFEQVRKCIVEKDGIDAVTPADVESSIKYIRAARKRTGYKMTKKDETEYRKYLNSRKACGDPLLVKAPEHNEAMCDVFSGYVLTRYWDDNPPKTDIDLLGGLSIFSSSVCSNTDLSARTLELEPIERLRLTHPIDYNRLNLILQMPGMDKHFRCQLKNPSRCYSTWGHHNRNSKETSTSPNSAKGGQK